MQFEYVVPPLSQSHRFSEVYFHELSRFYQRPGSETVSQSHRFSEVYFHYLLLSPDEYQLRAEVAIPSL